MDIESKILGKTFNFNAIHLGLRLDDNLWQHDKWIVTIEGKDFDYSTGIGYRKPSKYVFERGMKNYRGFKNEAEYYLKSHNWVKTKENLLFVNKKISKFTKVPSLDIDDVLCSLLIDSEVLDCSFDEWCDNFGVSNDSIKALNTYNECIKNGKKLRTFIPNLEEAREKFIDY